MPDIPDPEVAAAATIVAALEPMDATSRMRVLDWAQNRYGIWGRIADSCKAEVDAALRRVAELEAPNLRQDAAVLSAGRGREVYKTTDRASGERSDTARSGIGGTTGAFPATGVRLSPDRGREASDG